MPTPKKGARLGSGPAHQRLMVANLATALFENGRITTTEAKARMLRPVAERLITKAKRAPLGTQQSLHNRRQVLRTVRDKSVVHSLFTEIAPRFAERPGGYTRITKIGPRKGDNAPMAVIELVTEEYQAKAPSPSAGSAKKAAPAAENQAAPTDAEQPAEAAPAEVEATDASSETEAPVEEVVAVETAEEPPAEAEAAGAEAAEAETAETADAEAPEAADAESAEAETAEAGEGEPEEKPEA